MNNSCKRQSTRSAPKHTCANICVLQSLVVDKPEQKTNKGLKRNLLYKIITRVEEKMKNVGFGDRVGRL